MFKYVITLYKKLMKTLIVRENQVGLAGFTFLQYAYSSSEIRSLNADKGSTPNVRMRRRLAGIVLFT